MAIRPRYEIDFFKTLDAVKVVFRPQAILVSFAVTAILLEIASLLVLHHLKTGANFDVLPLTMFGEIALFLLVTWGISSISYDANSQLLEKRHDMAFILAAINAPLTYLTAPFVFIAAFFLIFLLQTGIVFLFTLSQLPIWAFSLLYVILFFSFVLNIVLVMAVIFYFFLWIPHAERMQGGAQKIARQFYAMLSERAFKAISQTFLWMVFAVLIFWFVLFPVWKLAVRHSLNASIYVMGGRIEAEITGRDNLLAYCVEVITDDSLLPSTFADNFKNKLPQPTEGTADVYRIRNIPSAGFLFIAALVLSFSFPLAIMLLLFCAGGCYSYLLVLGPERRTGTTTFEATPLSPPSSEQEQPVPAPHTREEDTFVDEIEPDVFEFLPKQPTEGKPLKKREMMNEFVDFEYVNRAEQEPAQSTTFHRADADKKMEPEPKDDGQRKLRNPSPQSKPEKKVDTEMGNFTIFDIIDMDAQKKDDPKDKK